MGETREAMVKNFGDKWAFQYNQEDGEKAIKDWGYEVVWMDV